MCYMRILSTLDQLQNGQRCRQVVWLEQAASPSCCHPCNVGLGMLGFGLSQDFHTNATRLAHFVTWCTAALVGCRGFIYLLFIAARKNLTSPRTLLSCVYGMYNRQTKRFSFMYISSGMVSLFPMLEKASLTIGCSAFLRLS